MARAAALWPWMAAVLSGALLGLCFPPFDQDWLVWIALCPLAAAVWFRSGARRTIGRDFLLGWLAGAIGFLICLHWITEVTVAGWVVLSIYCGVFPGLFAAILGFAFRPENPSTGQPDWLSSRRNLLISLGGAAVWVGCEWLRGWLFSGFAWNSLGVALWKNTPMIQIADIGGVGAVSFVITATNLVLVLTVRRLIAEVGTGAMKPHYDFALVLALVALTFTYGIRPLLAPPGDSTGLRFAAVQANIPQDEKWDPSFIQSILEKYTTLSEQAIAMDPDLLVWPEAATPRAVFSDPQTLSVVERLAGLWDGDFLLGTVHFDATGDFNSIVLLAADGSAPQFQHKIHLVPFGEFIPFRESFPVFAWIVGDLVPSDFSSGKEVKILRPTRKDVPLGGLVCFEDTIGRLARMYRLDGARLFVTVTNDGWFRESAGSMQHLAQSVFRCAENKIPMLRAANTGVTCTIDSFGRVVDILTDAGGSTFLEGILVGEIQVPDAPALTIYTKYGEWFSAVCFAWMVWGCFLALARKKKPAVNAQAPGF